MKDDMVMMGLLATKAGTNMLDDAAVEAQAAWFQQGCGQQQASRQASEHPADALGRRQGTQQHRTAEFLHRQGETEAIGVQPLSPRHF